MESRMTDLQALKKRLKTAKESDPALQSILLKCTRLVADQSHKSSPESVSKNILAEVVTPLFSHKRPWKQAGSWVTAVLLWISSQHPPLEGSNSLVPPILTLLEDDQSHNKQVGCQVLENVCTGIAASHSPVLTRTGLSRVFEEALAPNMLLLPTLTPEDESLVVLGRLYPCYRALIRATHAHHPASNNREARQAMLDRMVRDGLLMGYSHASENVRIATLLMTELGLAIEMMGDSSAKYLQTLLPLTREILSNPLGAAGPELLHATVTVLGELIVECRARVEAVWWAECLRATIGLWYAVMDEAGEEAQRVQVDARGLAILLLGFKPVAEGRMVVDQLLAEDDSLEGLFAGCPILTIP